MTGRVHLERDGDVLVVVVDSPSINAGSREVRAGLLSAVFALAQDACLRAGVIIGGGSTFIAGSWICASSAARSRIRNFPL
jgi:3-hydroxyacyl-CoA dehydrogenase